MQVWRSGYYHWLNKPARVITEQKLKLYRRARQLFAESKNSLGSRQLLKQLVKEGFQIGRYKVRQVMKKLQLKVIQRTKYKITTKRKYNDAVADNLMDQQFNPGKPDQYWAGDLTYLRTSQGWLYLAVVMDLYSRRIIGWSMHHRMTQELVNRAMKQAIHLRSPKPGLIYHSDRGSQYTSKSFRKLLKKHQITASMSGKGACWDNAVVERFFGSLKSEWLYNVSHLTREAMETDVNQYIRYYNQRRLHTANGDLSPIEYEQTKGSLNYVSKIS